MDRILIEENEIKPNHYVVRTMCALLLVMVICEILDELGIFKVNRQSMRIILVLNTVCTVIPLLVVSNKKLVEKPGTKYVVMSFALLELLLTMLILGQWTEPVLVMPILLAARYHSRPLNWFTVVGTIGVALLSFFLTIYLGLEQESSYCNMLEAIGYHASLTTIPDYSALTSAKNNLIYKGLPRLMILLALSTIVFAIATSSAENLEERINALYLSKTDTLTGLRNRFSYEAQTEYYEQKAPEQLACIYADADGLHRMNDERGHFAGDVFLKNCAGALKERFGEQCYRIGGDEFLIYAENMEETAIRAAEEEMYKNKSEYYLRTHKDRRKH